MPEIILIFGEGPTDYGKPGSNGNQWKDGPIQPLIRKSVCKEIRFVCVLKNVIKNIRIQSRRKPKGKSIASLKLCLYAKKENYSKIIFFSDADREQRTKNTPLESKKRFEKIYKEIINALNFIDNNSKEILLIPMVALKMIESWLLADENAFDNCYGKKPTSPSLPTNPEFIWGKEEDIHSDYPKHYLRRVLEQFNKQPCREIYHEIAEEIDIKTLKSKCSISFGKFFQDVQKI
ncbi:DUF4276 [Desulfonema limicola]|uniref:DUF4276 n=1 Tax=Desulfonema limicola TaxID=45656 RepID=A0A975B6F8_9BACT|nr:DUF4276 family protein [Desulfonema limicola]QTA79653.1 DUF4276 [Desulfonema limicola]